MSWDWGSSVKEYFNADSGLNAMPIVRIRMRWHTTQALTATVFSSISTYIPTYEPQLRSSSFLGFPSGFKAVSMFFSFWFELKTAGRCRFELKTPTYQSYIDTYIHTYIPTSVQPQFGRIGIVIGSAELRFQFNRIKNAYIPKLHWYIHRHLHTYMSGAVIR